MEKSYSVIEWFNGIDNKMNKSFLSFDIAEFYPSITEELLDTAVNWAKNFISIPYEHIAIIKHTRKSILFNYLFIYLFIY